MSKEVAPVAAGIMIIIKTKQEKPLAELRAAARDPNFELKDESEIMNPDLQVEGSLAPTHFSDGFSGKFMLPEGRRQQRL